MEVYRSLCHVTFDLWHYFPLLLIILKVKWQLLLVSCSAKIIQLLYCIASCKGACGALHKWLCWEFGVSTTVIVLL